MKAILVIDMPQNCLDCPCSFTFGSPPQNICEAMNDTSLTKENMNNTKPVWCPLKPFNENALKSGNKEYLIYQRDWLYKNLDREIEMLKSGKKYFDEILGETE